MSFSSTNSNRKINYDGDTKNTNVQLQSKIIKTDVTAVKIVFNFILAGIGNILHIFSIPEKNLCVSIPILRQHRIHGIHIGEDKQHLVCYGSREIVVAFLNFDSFSFTVISQWIVGDWIWDVQWQKNEIMILTANNIATLWNWKTKQKLKMVICEEKCLLYCGVICGKGWTNSIIFGGSMFKSILIWAPSISNHEKASILHKLSGHRGAIFSIKYHSKLHRICSTSDDRSVRIWQVEFSKNSSSYVESWTNANIMPILTVYGHTSRVWKSMILDNGRFITAGEDSQLRVWNEDGSPLYYWETHQGASIRCMSINDKQDLIVTGGKDGGLSLWHFNENEVLENSIKEIHFTIKKGQDVPRRILLSKLGRLLTVTNEGILLVHNGSKWNCIVSDARFASYCVFQISNNREYVSLASIFGDVLILKEHDDETLQKVYDGAIGSGRIFSFHWLRDDQFITCSTNGCLDVWKLKFDNMEKNYYLIKLNTFILPSSKERWLTSAIQIENSIVVGDRDGSVHVYFDKSHPLQTFYRIHGRLGVSCIGYDEENQIFSIGRDGFVRYWFIFHNKLEVAAADRLPVKWPVRILRVPSCGILVLGFNEINFEVWNINERKKLLTFNCGGGHRPWDFVIDKLVRFVYMREKVITYIILPSSKLLNMSSLMEGFHIRDIVCLRYLTNSIIISGGEDTTLRLSYIDKENNFRPAAIIRSFLSSVRAISFLRLNNSFLVASAGGRAQLKIWKIDVELGTVKYHEYASHMLKPMNKSIKSWQDMLPSYELEPRYMDIQIRHEINNINIYAAGSDACWRIFRFSLEDKTLKLIKEVHYKSHCILKILRLTWFYIELIITMSTDGKVTFWDAETNVILYQFSIHQSGINSCDYVILENGYLVLATGGDDTAVILSTFELSNDRIERCSYKSGYLHEAQVSGLRIIWNYLVSTGGDQKVALWKWKVADKEVTELELFIVHHSFIPDIHGLDLMIVNKDEVEVCVYGAGFEILKLSL